MIPAIAAIFSLQEIPAREESWNGSPALWLVYYIAVGSVAVASFVKRKEDCPMNTATANGIAILFAAAALALTAQSAEAKGCLKGAVVGGVAGHYAGHHGFLGAAAGCLYGRHRAHKQEQQQQEQQQEHQGRATDIGQTGM